VSRRAWIALGVVALAVVALLVLRNATHVPILSDAWGAVTQETSLPRRISVCGRDWTRGSLRVTRAEAARRAGGEPALVDAGLLTACPRGACSAAPAGPCHTVVYVRVDSDAYIGYGLVGGP
jgi:hypothetical protein